MRERGVDVVQNEEGASSGSWCDVGELRHAVQVVGSDDFGR